INVPDIGIYFLVSLGVVEVFARGLPPKTLLDHTSFGAFPEVNVFSLFLFFLLLLCLFLFFYGGKTKYWGRNWSQHILHYTGRIRIHFFLFLTKGGKAEE